MTEDAMVSRRTVLAAAVALITAAASTAAAGSGSSAELVWATGGVGADRDRALDVVARWHALHPDAPKVRVQPMPLSPNETQELLELELNAGLGSLDILSLDVVWIPEFAQRGWLVDLHEVRSEIERVSLPGPVRAAVWNGTLWAAPDTTDVGILYYRSDLVDKPPTTWDELVETGRRVGERNSIVPFVADGKQYEGMLVQYLEYFWGLGGVVFDRDGQVLFQPDKALQAVEFMRNAFLQGVYAPGFNTMDQEAARQTFQSGDAVFLRSWPYAYREMTGGDPDSLVMRKVGIAPLPTFPGHPPVAALGGHNLAVSAFSRNIPAATEFARFVATSRDVQLATFQRQSVAPPTLTAVYRDLAADPLIALLAKVLPTGRPRPATTQWATISAEMQQQIFAAYTGASEPKAAVDALRNFLIATVNES